MPKEIFTNAGSRDIDEVPTQLDIKWGDNTDLVVTISVWSDEKRYINLALTEVDLDRMINTLQRIGRGLTEVTPGDIIKVPSRRAGSLPYFTTLIALAGDRKGWRFQYTAKSNWKVTTQDEKIGETLDYLPDGEYVVLSVPQAQLFDPLLDAKNLFKDPREDHQ